MQESSPLYLRIGTPVSAKYKGAFCEARVRSVQKLVKVRVSFKHGLGSTIVSDEVVESDCAVAIGTEVRVRHPDTHDYLPAIVNKIQDQSLYTVVFDDGDITTLKRNALCIKSGKHFNASESLDNLPLTHPEHFSSPVAANNAAVGGNNEISVSGAAANVAAPKESVPSLNDPLVAAKRRRRVGSNAGSKADVTDVKKEESIKMDKEEVDSDTGSSDEVNLVGLPYVSSIGRVVWAENTEKKSKSRETWFPALIVTPSAASGYVKIDTRDDFLIRSFKDGRYYTISKKETHPFQRDSIKKEENAPFKDAMDRAMVYLDCGTLPPHWDREALLSVSGLVEDESTGGSTESSSEEDQLDDKLDDFELEEANETKDRLVAELYKYMEEKGAPINRTPIIANREVDLCLLFRLVTRLGGHVRVSSKSLWRLVAQKLGFDNTAWSINQVRVTYKRYLQSFEESRKQDANEPTNTTEESNSTTSSKDDEQSTVTTLPTVVIGTRVGTRPRRDSTSSLAAAIQARAQKDTIGEETMNNAIVASNRKPVVRIDREKEVEGEQARLQGVSNSSTITTSTIPTTAAITNTTPDTAATTTTMPPATTATTSMMNEEQPLVSESCVKSSKSSTNEKRSKKLAKRKDKEPEDDEADDQEDSGKQHLDPCVLVETGDRIKVFYKFDIIYEAKVLRVKERPHLSTNKFLVHYLGWNARYDEWIHRSRISENLSWTKERAASSATSKSTTPTETTCEKSHSRSSRLHDETAVATNKSDESSKKTSKQSKSDGRRSTTPPRSFSQRRASPAPASSSTTSTTISLKRQNSRASIKVAENRTTTEEEPQTRSQRSTRNSKQETVNLSRRVSGRKRGASQISKEANEVNLVTTKRPSSAISKRITSSSSMSSATSASRRASSSIAKAKANATVAPASSTEEGSSGSDDRETNKMGQPSSLPTVKRSTKNGSKNATALKKTASEMTPSDPFAFKEPESEVKSEPTESSKASIKKNIDLTQTTTAWNNSSSRRQTMTSSKSTSETTAEAMSLRRTKSNSSPTADDVVVKKESDANADIDSTPSQITTAETTTTALKTTVVTATTTSVTVTTTASTETAITTAMTTKERSITIALTSTTSATKMSSSSSSDDCPTTTTSTLTTKPTTPVETKPVLQLTKTQQELFPYLSATINMATVAINDEEVVDDEEEEEEKASVGLKSNDPNQNQESKGESKSKSESTSEAKCSNSKRQRKTPRKPNSSELVESDSDSEEPDSVTPNAIKNKEEPMSDRRGEKTSRDGNENMEDIDMEEEEEEEDSSKANTESSDPEGESKTKKNSSTPAHSANTTTTTTVFINTTTVTTTTSSLSSSATTSTAKTTLTRKPSRKRIAPTTASTPPKRKRRTREAVLKAAAAAAHSQREESALEMARIAEKVGDLANLDDEALDALTKGPAKKYNFFVQPKPDMCANERIAMIEKSIEELRQTYLNVKSELAIVERRRKRMRWRAKERGASDDKRSSDNDPKPEDEDPCDDNDEDNCKSSVDKGANNEVGVAEDSK